MLVERKIASLYTDGACSGNPGPGGWGVVVNLTMVRFMKWAVARLKQRTIAWSYKRRSLL
ncbi:hypothetical protein QM565_31945 [Geitlerinema splendidum]|nr:hypothetical protein [Geitlerinema splendidum]